MENAVKGRTGEQTAAFFLNERGYTILGRNQRTPLGELDIICRSLSEVVIVEVKARSGSEYGDALESIGPAKGRRLRAAAAWWLSDRGMFPCAVRFDVVTVALDSQGCPRSVHHLKNVLGN